MCKNDHGETTFAVSVLGSRRELSGNSIGRISTGGVFTEYPLPSANSTPFEITPGPDGALWFTEFGSNQFGRISTSGLPNCLATGLGGSLAS